MEEKKDELTINYPVRCYSEEQIKIALDCIDGNEPLRNVIHLTNVMHDFIVFNGCIDETIRNDFDCLHDHLDFHLKLLEQFSKIEL